MQDDRIKMFKIKGLFGDRDVHIKFTSKIKILIGENGLGKTTVLNILYYTLTNKLLKLTEFEFNYIELEFTNGDSVKINKDDIISIERDANAPVSYSVIRLLEKELRPKDIALYSTMFKEQYPTDVIMDSLMLQTNLARHYPPRRLLSALKTICGYSLNNENIKKYRELINIHFANTNTEIIYFPTFRRIEEDLINLGFDEKNLEIGQKDARLIQFGMQDVKEKLEEIKSEINTRSSKGLSAISSEILSQLVKGVPEIDQESISRISKNDIEIILARVGEAISKEDKKKIIEMVSDKTLRNSQSNDNRYLIYFLQKLIEIYDQQREIDKSIENFVSVCNKYLEMSNKEIFYEASEVDFYFISKISNKPVQLSKLLSKLSSGEKQIISLFAKIYLSNTSNFIVLFDEPELSLSIKWQRLLLQDIVDSGKCNSLLSVTHSPFIFDNNLAKYAIGLDQYIKFYNF